MTSNTYLLDTDTFSYITGNRYTAVRERFLSVPHEARCISAVTYAEISYGLEWAPQNHRIRSSVELFLGIVTILPWPVEAAPLYGREWSRLREGRTIGELDVMIAAHAMAIDAILVTNNTRHFQRIGPPLRFENWLE